LDIFIPDISTYSRNSPFLQLRPHAIQSNEYLPRICQDSSPSSHLVIPGFTAFLSATTGSPAAGLAVVHANIPILRISFQHRHRVPTASRRSLFLICRSFPSYLVQVTLSLSFLVSSSVTRPMTTITSPHHTSITCSVMLSPLTRPPRQQLHSRAEGLALLLSFLFLFLLYAQYLHIATTHQGHTTLLP